jgi:hypothetical protein
MIAAALLAITSFSIGATTPADGSFLSIAAPAQDVIRGIVTDSISGRPLQHALVTVVGTDRQIFSSASGRFELRDLPRGTHRIRVNQIGYVAAERAVTLGASEAPPLLAFALTRSEYRLPELVVVAESSGCPAGMKPGTAEPDPMVAEALANAERVRILEEEYPVRYSRDHLTLQIDDQNVGKVYRRDTLLELSNRRERYRRGRILERSGLTDSFVLFAVADLTTDEFRKSHCFGPDRIESEEGERRFVIHFEPIRWVRSPDWAGTMSVDSATGLLRAVKAKLVNLPERSTVIGAQCDATYKAVSVGLVMEHVLVCETANRSVASAKVLDTRILLSYRFDRRYPGWGGRKRRTRRSASG